MTFLDDLNATLTDPLALSGDLPENLRVALKLNEANVVTDGGHELVGIAGDGEVVRSSIALQNVVDFKLDSESDYTGAFQRATNTGHMTFVPTGTWNISANITGAGAFFFAEGARVNGAVIYSNCFSLRGDEDAVVNGAFVYWPEGTVLTNPAHGTHAAALFPILYDGDPGTFEVSLGGGPLSIGAANGLRWNQVVASPDSTYRLLEHRIEDGSVFNNTTATLSWISQNHGTAPVMISVFIVQFFGTGGSPSPSPDVVVGSQINIAVPVGSSRHQLTVDVPSTGGKKFGSDFNDCVKLQWYLPPQGTFDLAWAEVKYQRGTVRTPFRIQKYNEIIAEVERFLIIRKAAIGGKAYDAALYDYQTLPFSPMRGKYAPTVTYSFPTKVNVNALDPRTNFADQSAGAVNWYVVATAAGSYYAEGYIKIDARL